MEKHMMTANTVEEIAYALDEERLVSPWVGYVDGDIYFESERQLINYEIALTYLDDNDDYQKYYYEGMTLAGETIEIVPPTEPDYNPDEYNHYWSNLVSLQGVVGGQEINIWHDDEEIGQTFEFEEGKAYRDISVWARWDDDLFDPYNWYIAFGETDVPEPEEPIVDPGGPEIELDW